MLINNMNKENVKAKKPPMTQKIRKKILLLNSFNTFQLMMLFLIAIFLTYGIYSFLNNKEVIEKNQKEVAEILEIPPFNPKEIKTIFLPSGFPYREYKDTTLQISLAREISEEEFSKFKYVFSPIYNYEASFSKPNVIFIKLSEPKIEDTFLFLSIYLNNIEIFNRKFIQYTQETEIEQPGNYDYYEE